VESRGGDTVKNKEEFRALCPNIQPQVALLKITREKSATKYFFVIRGKEAVMNLFFQKLSGDTKTLFCIIETCMEKV
jgi:hypothetical protein